jgi:NTP pyrophosphatase (non-canonical NTP hydrolase)
MSDSNKDFEDLTNQIIEFCEKREWIKFHHPKELATAISIESAELEELFLWRGMENIEIIKSDHNRVNEISDEVADIIIYTILMAHYLNINLKEAITQKIKRNDIRFPIK